MGSGTERQRRDDYAWCKGALHDFMVHLRGQENILERLVAHSGAANLGLLMRTLFGKGTPRGLAGVLPAII